MKVKLEAGQEESGRELRQIKNWISKVEILELLKYIAEVNTSIFGVCVTQQQQWQKFKMNLQKFLIAEEEIVLSYMNKLKFEKQWLKDVYEGKVPKINSTTAQVFRKMQQISRKVPDISLEKVKIKNLLIREKIHHDAKTVFQECKDKIQNFVKSIKNVLTFKQLINSQTYFSFHNKIHESIILQHATKISVQSGQNNIDYGALVIPALSPYNNQIRFRINRNNLYRNFIGIGVCHPKMLKKYNYGISGCYMLRQESGCDQLTVFNNPKEKQPYLKQHKILKWGFRQGDIITLSIDYDRSECVFTKEKNSYRMKISLEEQIHGIVSLHSYPDSVSLLNS